MEPEFYSDRVEFMVTLKNLIKEEPQITQLQLQERLELSRSKVQRVMKKLREKGVIEHIGSKRSGYWNVDM